MKTVREIVLALCAAAFIMGGYIVIPYGHYERTYDENEFDPVVYSEHVVDYPTKNENILGFSLIVGSIIIGFSTAYLSRRKKKDDK